ncbi:MAG: helix-turn-helix domain-containing protein [Nanoarchaeota archaeon]
MSIESQLGSLGLSDRESRVYLALLDLGPTTTSKLIRKTGVSSSKIYDVLEKLMHRGLAAYVIKHGKKEFHPSNPEKLFDLIKEKESTVDRILPDLKRLYEETAEEVQAEVFKGKEGIKSVFEDILKTGKGWHALGASGKAAFTLPYYMPHFYKRMQTKKIALNILFVDSEITRKQKEELDSYKNVKIKFLPKRIRNLMVIFIYGDKVAVIPMTGTVEMAPLAIVIKSKESAESYRDYFNWLWKICRT